MKFKFIFAIMLSVLFSLSFISAAEDGSDCYFDFREGSCEVFSDSFNKFSLAFSDIGDLYDYSVIIYDKTNPSNKIDTMIEGNDVYNVQPFTKPGIYVFQVSSKNRVGASEVFDFEFVFDNLKPNAPVVPIDLDTVDNMKFTGKANFAKTVTVDFMNGNTKTVDVSDDGSYNFDLSLSENLNYVQFFSTGVNGLESTRVERVIYKRSDTRMANLRPEVSDISIVDNSEINKVVSGMTSKRNFYVSGSVGVANAIVYVNGVPTQAGNEGVYGAFVLLNEGDNTIEVKSGTQTKTIDIKYVNPKFQFTSLEVPKSVSSNPVEVYGSSNYAVPFNAYLNGKFYSKITNDAEDFTFTLNGLKEGKNYIYLEGVNGDFVSEVVYLDKESPEIEVLSHPKMSYDGDFIFKISDEFGVDVNSLEIKIGVDKSSEIVKSNSLLEIYDDVFVLDIEGEGEGRKTYTITAKDLSGNIVTENGEFSIDSENTIISSIYFDEGEVLGSAIFSSENSVQLNVVPSKNIAFEKVVLDGLDVTDYKIQMDSLVVMNLDFLNSEGVLELTFIDSSRQPVTQSFKYYVLEEPSIDLDFIDYSFVNSNEKVKVLGKVNSEYFDWSSFEINGERVLRFGNYFEAYVNLDSGNLNLFGNDFIGSNIETSRVFGVGLDSTNTKVVLNSNTKYSFKGTLEDVSSTTFNFAKSYDGSFSKSYLPRNFDLGSEQRNGLRSIALEGYEESSNKFYSRDVAGFDNMKPRIFFFEDKMIVDGTLGGISLVNVNTNSNVNVNEGRECTGSKLISSDCLIFSLPQVGSVVEVVDDLGNLYSRSYDGNQDTVVKTNQNIKIYANGNDKITSQSSYFVQGNIISASPIISVKGDGVDCEFDDISFVCLTTLTTGPNSIKVIATNSDGASASIDIPVELKDSSLNVDLLDISGGNVFKVSDEYYTDDLLAINFKGDVSREALISLFVNGKEILSKNQKDEFTLVELDLSNYANGVDKVNLNVEMKAEDEFGNVGFSEKVLLIYHRVFETLVDVIVG